MFSLPQSSFDSSLLPANVSEVAAFMALHAMPVPPFVECGENPTRVPPSVLPEVFYYRGTPVLFFLRWLPPQHWAFERARLFLGAPKRGFFAFRGRHPSREGSRGVPAVFSSSFFDPICPKTAGVGVILGVGFRPLSAPRPRTPQCAQDRVSMMPLLTARF